MDNNTTTQKYIPDIIVEPQPRKETMTEKFHNIQKAAEHLAFKFDGGKFEGEHGYSNLANATAARIDAGKDASTNIAIGSAVLGQEEVAVPAAGIAATLGILSGALRTTAHLSEGQTEKGIVTAVGTVTTAATDNAMDKIGQAYKLNESATIIAKTPIGNVIEESTNKAVESVKENNK